MGELFGHSLFERGLNPVKGQHQLLVAVATAFRGLLWLVVRNKFSYWHFPELLFALTLLLLGLFGLIFLAVLRLSLRCGWLELLGLSFGLPGLVQNLEDFGVRYLRVGRQIFARHLLDEFELLLVELVLCLVRRRLPVLEKIFLFGAIRRVQYDVGQTDGVTIGRALA